jgi:hypothetical protein
MFNTVDYAHSVLIDGSSGVMYYAIMRIHLTFKAYKKDKTRLYNVFGNISHG